MFCLSYVDAKNKPNNSVVNKKFLKQKFPKLGSKENYSIIYYRIFFILHCFYY